MKFSELIGRVGRRGVSAGSVRVAGDPEIGMVWDDSRRVRKGDLFVARAGTKVSGAQFAADAVARGAVAVVSEEPLEVGSGVAFAQVGDAALAAAMLAHEVAGNPTAGMKVIGVTGTKGKTTVAYLLRSILREALAPGHLVGMIGTVEIDDGKAAVAADMTTPGSIELAELFKRMKANGVTHCVMEVSSHALHQKRVAGVEFAVGVFTNLTGDHLDYHKTMDEYGAAKAILFEGLGAEATAVFNADDAYAARMVKGCRARQVSVRVGQTDATWSAGIEQMDSAGMRLNVRGPGGVARLLETPLVGKHNAYNLLSAIGAARAVGVDVEAIFATLKKATGAPGRLQRVEGDWDIQVFVDYAHTHDALQNVLTAMRGTMKASGKPGSLVCVFGCGGDRDRTKRPKMGRIAEELADRVYVTSDNPRTEVPGAIIEEICAGLSGAWREAGKVTVEGDRRAAIRAAIANAVEGDVVVIAGKGHENYQIIGTTKHHFDDVEEAAAALAQRAASAGSQR